MIHYSRLFSDQIKLLMQKGASESIYQNLWCCHFRCDFHVAFSHRVGGNRKRSSQSTKADQKSKETVFSIVICRQSGDKWQSKTLFLTIFDLRSSIVLTFSIAAYPVWYCTSRFKKGFWLNRNPSSLTSPHQRSDCICVFAHTFEPWQCGILTSVDSDEPVHPLFKLRNSKWYSVSSLTLIEYLSD